MLRRLVLLQTAVLVVYTCYVAVQRLQILEENANTAIWEARLPWLLDKSPPAAVTSALKSYGEAVSAGKHFRFQNPSDTALAMISVHARKFKKHSGWSPLIGVDVRTHAVRATTRHIQLPSVLGPIQPRLEGLLALLPDTLFGARVRGVTAAGAADLGSIVSAVGSRLEYVLLSGNTLGGQGVDAAVPEGIRLERVKDFRASGCDMGTSLKHFQLLDRIPNVAHLDLSNNRMSGAHVLSLFPISPRNEAEAGASPLCCSDVRHLNLEGNPMGPESATLFLDMAAKMMPKLEHLRMDILVESRDLIHLFSVGGTALASNMLQLKSLHIGLALGHNYSVTSLAEALHGLRRIKTETFELKIYTHSYQVQSWLPRAFRKQLKLDGDDRGRDVSVQHMATIAKTLQTLQLTKLTWLHGNSKTEGRKAVKGVLKRIKQTREDRRAGGAKVKYDAVIFDDGVTQPVAPPTPPEQAQAPSGPATQSGEGLERWSDKIQQRREQAMKGRHGDRDEM